MTAGAAIHATVIVVDAPPEVAVGVDFMLTVRVSCPAGCDLSDMPIEVTTPDGATTAITSAAGDTDMQSTRHVALTAPLLVGEHIWRLSGAACESGGWHHDACLLHVPVRIRPHEASLAVWAIPSPVVMGKPFALKVGARSTAGCNLTGMRIAVCDEAGTVLATDILGAKPWPGTSGLYWCELTLTAPAVAGMFSWSVKFAAADLALPHQSASSRFTIAIVDAPEHKLTVKVVERETATPIENAQVRLGTYRAATSGSGVAELMLPKGSYDLDVWKSGYEASTTHIAVDADLAVEVVIAVMPEENSDAAWPM